MAETYSRRPTRRHPIQFKRLVAEEFLTGNYSKNSLAKRHDVARLLVTQWTEKYQNGEFDDITDVMVADLISKNKKLESLVVRQSIEIDELRGRVAALAF
jgi:transposase-like protein